MGSDIDPIDLDYPDEVNEREDDRAQTALDSHIP
jgi:hypothetical protein